MGVAECTEALVLTGCFTLACVPVASVPAVELSVVITLLVVAVERVLDTAVDSTEIVALVAVALVLVALVAFSLADFASGKRVAISVTTSRTCSQTEHQLTNLVKSKTFNILFRIEHQIALESFVERRPAVGGGVDTHYMYMSSGFSND